MQIDFKKTEFLSVAAQISQCPYQIYPEIVLAGRSNVGKSSFINALGQNNALAKTSSTPGKTKLVIYFLTDKSLLFADLPGYGFTKASKSKREEYADLVDNYFVSDREITFVIHFMDIRHAPSKEDLQMRNWMETNNIRYFIVLSKADKLSRIEMQKRLIDFKTEYDLKPDIPVIAFSIKSRAGLDDIKHTIQKWINETNKKK